MPCGGEGLEGLYASRKYPFSGGAGHDYRSFLERLHYRDHATNYMSRRGYGSSVEFYLWKRGKQYQI